MSLHFHPLIVNQVRRETAECVSVAFSVPNEFKEIFSFTQGQYVTLRTNIHEQEIRRSYSICSSTLENELRIAIKKVTGGVFSTYANEVLKVGDTIDVMPPIGKFFTDLHHFQYSVHASYACLGLLGSL